MDLDRFRDSPIGSLEPISIQAGDATTDYFAYLPAPLPAGPRLNASTYYKMSSADQALGMLEGVARNLPNKSLLVRPIIRREAVSTSALEGTYTGLSEVLQAEVVEPSRRRPRSEVLEVLRYTATAEYALDRIQETPVSLNLVRELHARLMRGRRGDAADTGEFRRVQVMIGPQAASPTEAHFIPPPPGEQMMRLLGDWEAWNYAVGDVPIIARVAISQYQFETIHPFRDGNGRLGRLVAVLLLIDRGPLSGHLFSLSPFLETRRQQYGELLRQVSATGNWNDWVSFFAEAVKVQAESARDKAARLITWRDESVARLRSEGVKGVTIALAEDLVGYPVVTAAGTAERLGVTFRTANRAIGILTGAGLLVEVTGRDYGRVFAAPAVVTIVEE